MQESKNTENSTELMQADDTSSVSCAHTTEITPLAQLGSSFIPTTKHGEKVAKHSAWLKTIRHETPNPAKPFKVGVYIRYFNQTKYENYLDYHKKQYEDVLAQYPKWTFVGFYIDEGATAPYMESAPEWSRLLNDCMEGKVDLIITQKVSNVSKDMMELTLLARYFAALPHPIGMYFASEDIFTLATYYRSDTSDKDFFFPSEDWKLLPDDNEESLKGIAQND